MKNAPYLLLLLAPAIPAHAQTTQAASSSSSSGRFAATSNNNQASANSWYSSDDSADDSDGPFCGTWAYSSETGHLSIPPVGDTVTSAHGDEDYLPSTILDWHDAVKMGREEKAAATPKTSQAAPAPAAPARKN